MYWFFNNKKCTLHQADRQAGKQGEGAHPQTAPKPICFISFIGQPFKYGIPYAKTEESITKMSINEMYECRSY